jgi:hypothetical protein
VVDNDIKSPDPTKIDWSAIHQEMEYDQQRELVTEEKEPQPQQQSQHPLLLLHQLQQDNLSMMFTKDELLFMEPTTRIHIDDILLTQPRRPSLSSPGQLFKSKFQKAVKKMKKSNKDISKRSSIASHGSIRAESLPITFHQDDQPTLSPRPSASARVHDHLKCRLNKLFKK